MGFGLAKAIATPIMEYIQNKSGISSMFYILGFIYFIMMFIGHLLLKKPDGWQEENDKKSLLKVSTLLKNKTFIGIWLVFFINIHCGLALITYEKQIISETFKGLGILAIMISVIPSVTAFFNALGRIGYSTISDKMKDRNTVYKIILSSSFFISLIGLVTFSISNGSKALIYEIIVILLLVIVNLGYGGGFSTLPALLSSRFGMKKISKIHGISLSAWAIAGITGNNMSELILNLTNRRYDYILLFTFILYLIAFIICKFMIDDKEYNI